MDNKDEWALTADLACLKLNAREQNELSSEAAKMDDLFALLEQAQVDGVEPTTHALIVDNRLREDVAANFEGANSLIDNAPDSEDGFIVIPNLL